MREQALWRFEVFAQERVAAFSKVMRAEQCCAAQNNLPDHGSNFYQCEPELRFTKDAQQDSIQCERDGRKNKAPDPNIDLREPSLHQKARGIRIDRAASQPLYEESRLTQRNKQEGASTQ